MDSMNILTAEWLRRIVFLQSHTDSNAIKFISQITNLKSYTCLSHADYLDQWTIKRKWIRVRDGITGIAYIRDRSVPVLVQSFEVRSLQFVLGEHVVGLLLVLILELQNRWFLVSHFARSLWYKLVF